MPVKRYSYEKDKDLRLSDHFAVREFRARRGTAPDGDEILIATELIERLERLSDRIGNRPIIVTDGYRTPAYDLLLTGQKGQHTLGKAADIKTSGIGSRELAAHAQTVGFDGIGIINDTAIHVDVRGYPSYFIETGISAASVTKVETFLHHEDYRRLVQERFGFADNTIEYLDRYTWREDLFRKLWEKK